MMTDVFPELGGPAMMLVFMGSPFQSRACLKQFDFETLPTALDGETSFAHACGAGGDFRRQSVFTFSMSKCSKHRNLTFIINNNTSMLYNFSGSTTGTY
jgi:hypothetical protein